MASGGEAREGDFERPAGTGWVGDKSNVWPWGMMVTVIVNKRFSRTALQVSRSSEAIPNGRRNPALGNPETWGEQLPGQSPALPWGTRSRPPVEA